MKHAVVLIRREPAYRRAAFEAGFKRLGFTVHDRLNRPGEPGSVLCIWNRKRGKDEQDAEAWERRGGVVLIAENGYLAQTPKTHYALSIGQHHGITEPSSDENRFDKLGFKLKPWKDDAKGYWLVCSQRGIGSSLMASPPQWAEKMAVKMRAAGREVLIRQHPGENKPKTRLEDDLKGAHACAIWSSGAGVRALVEGVPVYHSAPRWICAGAGPNCREEVLNRMAWNQWHYDEIATGAPIARLLESTCW